MLSLIQREVLGSLHCIEFSIFQARWFHFGDQYEIFFSLFASPSFLFACSLPILWGFPLHKSLPSLEDTWSSDAASLIFLLSASCFLFLQISSLCHFILLVSYLICLLNKSYLLTLLSSQNHGFSSFFSDGHKIFG